MTRPPGSSGLSRELIMRLASAAVLIPIGLFCVWQGGLALSIIAALCAGAMAFEWARMAKSHAPYLMILGTVLANIIHLYDARWALMVLVGVGVVAMMTDRKHHTRSSALLGTLYAGGLPLAMQVLRAFPEAGWALAMGVMLLSWASDTSAYFVGRQLRGPLLAPKDSPNKTWSGAIGAVGGAMFAGAAFGALLNAPVFLWALFGVIVSVSAQVGDLFESQIKRRHDIKDTSGFLPGHGGVMDRLDGFGSACVVVVALIKLFPAFGLTLVG